jgi:hypothetical protein
MKENAVYFFLFVIEWKVKKLVKHNFFPSTIHVVDIGLPLQRSLNTILLFLAVIQSCH